MKPSIADECLRGDYEANTNGEPDALKGARPVRKGIERKGLATAPRSQSTLHEGPEGDILFLFIRVYLNLRYTGAPKYTFGDEGCYWP